MTIRQQIIPDDEVRNLVKEMRELPQRIHDAQDGFEDAQYSVSTFNDDKRLIEEEETIYQEHYFLVREEKTEAGKPKFTNEEQRKGETRRRCNRDEYYIETKTKVLGAKQRKRDLELRVGKLNNIVKGLYNQKYAVNTLAEMVSGLCHEDVSNARIEEFERLHHLITTMKDGGNTREERQSASG